MLSENCPNFQATLIPEKTELTIDLRMPIFGRLLKMNIE